MSQPHSSTGSCSGPVSCRLADLAATRDLAEKLAAIVAPGDILALAGPIGAGKTTFARFFISAIGYREDVPSPTFTLVQTYEGEGLAVWHFDLYRLTRPEDVYELGIEQAFDEGVTLIEWPERMGALLPSDALCLTFRNGAEEQERLVVVDPGDSWVGRIEGAGLAEFRAAPQS